MWDAINESDIKIQEEILEDRNPDLYVQRAEEALKDGYIDMAIDEIDMAVEYGGNKRHSYVLEKIKILKAANRKNSCKALIKEELKVLYNRLSRTEFFEVLRYYKFCGANNSQIRELLEKNAIEPMFCYIYDHEGYFNTVFYLERARIVNRERRLEEAITFLEFALCELGTDFDILMYMSRLYEAYGRDREALSCYDRILTYFPGYAKEVYPSCIKLCKQKNWSDKGLDYCEQYLVLVKGDMEAIQYKYQILFGRKEYAQCVGFLQQHLEQVLLPTDKGILQKQMAECYDLLGKDIHASYYYYCAKSNNAIAKVPKNRPTRGKTIRRRIAILILMALASVLAISATMLYSTGKIPPKYYNVTTTGDYTIMMPKETMKLDTSYDKKPSFGIDGIIEYKSSDESIVTVSKEGMVEALKPGEAEINVLISGKLYTSYRIQVIKPKVEDIEIELESFSGEYDSYHYMEASVIMNIERAKVKEVKYASSNEQVAEVSEDGVIHIVGVGESYITASAGEVEKTIVVQGTPRIESITLDGLENGEIVLEADASFSIKVNAQVEPKSAELGDNIIYSIQNESVAWLSGNIIYASNSGDTVLEVSVNGYSYYFPITVLEKARVSEAYIRERSTGQVINYLSLYVGESSEIYADFNYYPTTAKEPTVTYSVDEQYSHVIKVNAEGVVTVLGEGEAEVIITIGDYVQYLPVEGEQLPISEFEVENLKAKYNGNNIYELAWSPIEGYEHAEYIIYRNGQVYDYTDDLSYEIDISNYYDEVDICVRAKYNSQFSKESKIVTLYVEEAEEAEDSTITDSNSEDVSTDSDDSEDDWIEIN